VQNTSSQDRLELKIVIEKPLENSAQGQEDKRHLIKNPLE